MEDAIESSGVANEGEVGTWSTWTVRAADGALKPAKASISAGLRPYYDRGAWGITLLSYLDRSASFPNHRTSLAVFLNHLSLPNFARYVVVLTIRHES